MSMFHAMAGILGGGAAPPLSINITPSSLEELEVSCPITTDLATGNESNGTPPYTYLWDFTAGGGGLTINSPTSKSTTVTRASVGAGFSTLRCTVTDDVSDTAADSIQVEMECGT